ncbi:D-alanyl-D-alanine carboxypeptidase family protein [Actinomadura scrupuli]|uniref:D-alanyl-D-alanine carboxypeptidase family protein n=1 Tax=Actinomadura scrupuli TaxID=559629 RepID=UPI003D984EB2
MTSLVAVATAAVTTLGPAAAPFGGAAVAAVASARAGGAPAARATQAVRATTAVRSKGPAGIRARAAYLFDASAGRTMWSRHPATRLPIGSTTKVMTALVVIRRGHLDRKITIKRRYIDYAIAHHGSRAGLRAGDRITARELLYAMLLPSGCEAAAALADVYGPGQAGFVRAMNRLAAKVGMRRTHYANFDGTPWPTPTSGYSTARDMVVLGRYALRYPLFREIVHHSRHVLPAGAGHRRYVWRSTNILLHYDPGVIGIKTGYTSAAGSCSLFAARSGGRELIGVVLNSSRTNRNARVIDAIKMLNWGFAH